MIRAAVLVLTLSVAASALAQYPPGMTMHRVQAGKLDASGWTTARSTEGRFMVRLPLPFNDFTIREKDARAGAASTFVVGAKSAEGLKFTATRVVFRKAGHAAAQLARLERGEGFPTKPQKVRRLTIASRQAVDIELSSGAAVLHQRVVLAGEDLVTLAVESPVAHRRLAAELVPTFFESLAVDPP